MQFHGLKSKPVRGADRDQGDAPLAGSASGSLTRRERERIRCSDEIIAAASRLFAKLGIEKTSMKQIADEADVSVGKLYTYFRGKQEIVHRLLDKAFRELERKANEASREGDSPLEQLRCRLKASIAHFAEHLDFLMIYHNENPMSCEGMIRREIEKFTDDAAALFARAIEEGEILQEDPRILASLIIGGAHSLLHMYAMSGNKEAFEDVPAMIDRLIIRPLEVRQTRDLGMEGR